MEPYEAILVVGPTGAGKTPLGDYLEANGLWGKRCAHFDFGAQLRRIDDGDARSPGLSGDDVAFVGKVLRAGALLENEHFHIAREILVSFAQAKGLSAGGFLVLNGLPRHVDQARDVDSLVNVRMVVHLECSAETVSERIRLNSGGDRAGRVDDSLPEIERKLSIFRDRTLPLLTHYRERGARIEPVEVGVHTTPDEIHRKLSVSAPVAKAGHASGSPDPPLRSV